ncbi:transcriptional regulator [Alteribacter lacisalsi]|uniref:Transcriptional regulator n=1 Tax=Alteribacter lacisalsi TaxID=2045244 RepID=A0A2W0H5H9_9BACI|nr:FMN-binding negative transcriptional regulator [Alteribacter lacisalsi]PYZ96387.1 transcriptional regulator [Alteribacter lacisalsi]
MYIPSHFKITDHEFIYNFIQENGFASFISMSTGEPVATHLPLMLDEKKEYLQGHLARPNPQWKDLSGQKVLAIFQGPHCYISPSWYETDRSVPTWNYVAVHVYGTVKLMDGTELTESLIELVKKYEAPDSSYQIDNVDPGFLEGMTKGVVGFKVRIDRIEGKAKLSQNHSSERKQRVIDELEKVDREDERQIASYMKKLL